MDISRSQSVLCISLFLMMNLVSCGGNSDDTNQDPTDISENITDPEGQADSKPVLSGNLLYIESASIIVNELWVRDTDGNETELLKNTPKTVNLVPSGNDFADMYFELAELTPGKYDRVRLVLKSGEVLLTSNVHVAPVRANPRNRLLPVVQNANPYLFTTQLGNLKFPSGFKSGIKVNIEPPVQIVTNLETKLLVLSFDLNKSFVFNGDATKEPGIKRVLFKPVIKVSNDTTHGLLSLAGIKGTSGGVKCTAPELLPGATVTAVDINGNIQTVTTDSEGNAELILLKGSYIIRISKPGYTEVSQSADIDMANNTLIADVILSRNREFNEIPVFDRDIAILMTIMADTAYATNDLPKLNEGDNLSSMKKFDNYPYGTNITRDYTGSCWKFYKYVRKSSGDTAGDNFGDTQFFVAYHENTGDIVVSFTGTETNGQFADVWTDMSSTKGAWTLRTGTETIWTVPEGKKIGGEAIDGAIHRGMREAYFNVVNDFTDPGKNLKLILDNAIAEKVTDPSVSRIYFTGHSLGGGLASIAALDFANYLVKQKGYQQNNIVMYAIGTPHVVTRRLRSHFGILVPNSFSVVAKDDVFTHWLSPTLNRPTDQDQYVHLDNLVVLNTNILDYKATGEVERYTKIGQTRIEYSKGRFYNKCEIPIYKSVGEILSQYEHKGHSVTQYIRRLETVLEGGRAIPVVALDAINIGSSVLENWKLQLRWGAGVQGPCDWVGLYVTERGAAAPTTASTYLKTPPGSWQWVVNGQNYGTSLTSFHTTDKNPTVWNSNSKLEDKDFWIGYVDGFGRIIRARKWDRKLN